MKYVPDTATLRQDWPPDEIDIARAKSRRYAVIVLELAAALKELHDEPSE